eukprot:g6960.t1
MSGYASRTEIQQLEARLLQAEKELQIQGQNMQLLQAQLETLLGPQQGLYQTAVTTPVATALRERSRTPTPLSGVLARGAVFPGMWEHTPVAAVVPAASEITGGLLGVQQFIAQNQLDEKCIEALTTQPPEVQTHVINQGPAEGRNPSAMVMGRIAKAQRELESLYCRKCFGCQMFRGTAESIPDLPGGGDQRGSWPSDHALRGREVTSKPAMVDPEGRSRATERLRSRDLDGIAQFMADHARHVVGSKTPAPIENRVRSPGTGLYHNLQRFDLPEAEAIFDLKYFQKHPDAFYELCREMWPGNYAPTACHYFIRLLSDKGILQRQLTQDGAPLSPRCFTTGISTCARSRLWRDALALFDFMKVTEVSPNLFNYSAVINACGRNGQWEISWRIFQEMSEMQISPDVVSYGTAISCFDHSSQWDLALHIFHESQRSGGALGGSARALGREGRPNGSSVGEDIVGFSAMISALDKAGRWEDSLSLFEEMSSANLSPDTICLSAVISACGKGRQWQLALEILHEKVSEPDVICFSAAISACKKAGEWKFAVQLLQEMEDQKTAAWFEDSMFSARNRQVMPEASMTLDAISYNATISSCAKGAQWQTALQLLDTMLSVEVWPDVISCTSAISACEKDARIQADATSFNALISSCDKSEEWEMALHLLEEMLQVDLQPDLITYTCLLNCYETARQWQRALELFAVLPEIKVTPDKISYNVTVSPFPAVTGLFEETSLADEVARTGEGGARPLDLAPLNLTPCYTQNIDSLEHAAGIPAELLVAAHGNFDAAHVVDDNVGLASSYDVDITELQDALHDPGDEGWQELREHHGGLVKPKIVFFGEELPKRFFELHKADLALCDLLLVMGTSLQVSPFNTLLSLTSDKPRLLINREAVGSCDELAGGFCFQADSDGQDVFYQGDCDAGVEALAERLGWLKELQELVALGQKEAEELQHSELWNTAVGALGAEAAALDLSIETLVFALRAPQAPGSWHAMATWAKSELHQDGVVLSSSERPDDERQEKLEVPTSDPPEPPEPVERAAELAEPGERAAEPVEPAERAAERAAEPVEPEERAAAVEPQPADEPASHEKWHVEKTPDETQEEKPEPASVYPQFYADRRCPLDAAKSEHQERLGTFSWIKERKGNRW